MKIAISGKGGSGKTTIAGTLARVVAGQGRQVVAVDDDSNPNLAVTLGLTADRASAITGLPRDFLEDNVEPDGTRRLQLTVPVDEVLARHGVAAAPNLTLLVMGQPSHGGSG
jgi:CO dehydrogenase maturation factor